jgi:hypothetical protein
MARGYIGSGKAEPCNPPKEVVSESKKKRKIPGARSAIAIRKIANVRHTTISDIADSIIGEDQ